jgi:exonuclease III
MPFTVATWNINSVRLRMPLVEHFLREYAPDVLCLQETKCPDDAFPFKPLRNLGYEHIEISGQKGYHGVATIARRPIRKVSVSLVLLLSHLSISDAVARRMIRGNSLSASLPFDFNPRRTSSPVMWTVAKSIPRSASTIT